MVVNTNVNYSYSVLQNDIQKLQQEYPFLVVGNIGRSVLGKTIPYIRIGNGQKQVFYNASFHANEWITTPVLMKFIDNYANAYKNNSNIFGYNARNLYNQTTLFIVPMVNPDGVNLVTGELGPGTSGYNIAKAIANGYPEIPFPSGWKANIQGIDLNLQFPAGWVEAKRIKSELGFTRTSSKGLCGSRSVGCSRSTCCL